MSPLVGAEEARLLPSNRRPTFLFPAWGVALSALLLLAAAPLDAHDARPLSVAIFEQTGHVYRYRLRVPETVERINQPALVWPEGCAPAGDGPEAAAVSSGAGGLVVCEGPLDGRTIRVVYALFNPSISTVFRYTPRDGAVRTSVLPPDRLAWTVPAEPGRSEVAHDYLRLGIEHILAGLDHLLFVAGLLLIARTGRRVLVVVTGFTLAHSVTLSLSAIGWIHVPVPPVEAAIALSILFVAHEIARGREQGLTFRYPVLVSSSFGLLHGLGFAAALSEIGLPPREIVTALLFFNLGVEVGQLLFILPLMAGGWLLGRLGVWGRVRARGAAFPAFRTLAAYAIGVPASFWLFERLSRF